MTQIPDPGGPTVTDRFEIIDVIGKGGYGTVYKARDKSTQTICALKKIKTFDIRQGTPSSFFRETECLKALKGCKNVLDYKSIFRCHENNCFFLVLEYCDCDLGQIIRHHFSGNSTPLFDQPYEQILPHLMHQILVGMHEIHSKGFIHRDVKPTNILYSFNDPFGIKIGDFGLSRNLTKCNQSTRPLSPLVSTPYYRAPELLLGSHKYDQSIDTWSIGCLFFEMVTGRTLFKPISNLNSDFEQLLTVFKICGTPDTDIWPDMPNSELVLTLPKFPPNLEQVLDSSIDSQFSLLKDLLLNLLQINPSHRISILDALSHPFFTTPISNSEIYDKSEPFSSQLSSGLSSENSISPTHNEFALLFQPHQISTKSIQRPRCKKKRSALRPSRIYPPSIGVF